MTNSILLTLAAIICIAMSGLFSGSETGLYRLSRLRLRLGVEKKRLPFILLSRCVHDSSGLLLTILIGNNLVNYLTTSIITYSISTQIDSWHWAEIITTIVTVPILFVFGESIPKNLFFYRADTLMPYTAPFLYILHKLLKISGIIYVLRITSNFITKLVGSSTPSKTAIASIKRHAVHAILKDTHEEGLLSSVQTDIINRLVKISNVYVKSVMIPMDEVQAVTINSDRAALLKSLENHNHTRLPVKDSTSGSIIGYINIYDVLSIQKSFTELSSYILPLQHINAETNITDAIRLMQAQKQNMLLVVKSSRSNKEKPIGIITMKDLVEEIIGELAEW